MRPQPPKWLEKLVGVLLPASERETILGDLAERYSSPLRYVVDALSVLWAAHCVARRRKHRAGTNAMPFWTASNRFDGGLAMWFGVGFTASLAVGTFAQGGATNQGAGLFMLLACLLAASQILRRRLYLKAKHSRTEEQQIQARLDAIRNLVWWYAAPICLALLAWVLRLIFFQPHLWYRAMPFTIGLLLWGFFTWLAARRIERELSMELERKREG
jgi:hypothetical protein